MFPNATISNAPKMLLPALLMAALAVSAACSSDETSSSDNLDPPETAEEAESVEAPDSPGESATPEQVELATAFWDAVEADDPEAAVSFLDPAAEPDNLLFGRAGTLPGQFEWYQAVGMSWELEDCEADGPVTVACTANARNRWSDALGVDPVTGTFTVWFGEEGIVTIVDQNDSFVSQWGPMVFGVFAQWVDENRPEDAAIMFGDQDVNPEILGLYADNTDRFVEAQRGP